MFGCFSIVIWQMKLNKIRVLHSLQGPHNKKYIYKRAEKSSLAACEFEKHSRFHTQNKFRSDLKKLFGSYLLQLREAERKEEVTESYFMGFSHSNRKLQRLLLP